MSKRSPSIVVSIGHAAHVQLFQYLIDLWRGRGWEVRILARAKPLVEELLDARNVEYSSITKPGRWYGQYVELVLHWTNLYLRFLFRRPKMVISVSGILSAFPSRLLGINSVIVYDTEDARLSNKIAYPFAHHILTPIGYLDDLGAKHTRFPSFHELAYAHPDRFSLNQETLRKHGLGNKPYVVVRFVKHSANHDIGQAGFNNDGRARLLNTLLERGFHVWVSSEDEIDEQYRQYLKTAPGEEMIHILAGANAYVGESPTMAMEAGACGVPASWVSTRVGKLGYVQEMEQEFGLVECHTTPDTFFPTLDRLLSQKAREDWSQKRERLRQERIDLTEWLDKWVCKQLGVEAQ